MRRALRIAFVRCSCLASGDGIAFVKMVASLDRPQLRELLMDTLRTDGDFNAFVLDYFPDVHRGFTGEMDRTSKLNLLLESVDGDDILRALIKLKPALAARLHIAAASAPAALSVKEPLATTQGAFGPLVWIPLGFFVFVAILVGIPMCRDLMSAQRLREEANTIRNSVDMKIQPKQTTPQDVSVASLIRQEHINRTESSTTRKPNPEMIRIASSKFQMGSDSDSENERPFHQEHVISYWIDKTEVTVRDYISCINAKRCSEPKSDRGCNWKDIERKDHPVNCVDWYQAKQFCNWLGRRLPTEVEWEYAARGPNAKNSLDFPNGNICWKRIEKQATCPVGKSSSDISPLGIYDMAANVYEWVQDNYRLCHDKACSVSQYEKVVRGGAWSFPIPNLLRLSARNRHTPTEYCSSLGFRCAK